MGQLRKTFASGLIILVPILLTGFLVSWTYTIVARVPFLYMIDPPVLQVLMTIAVMGLMLYIAGHFSRSLFGLVLTSIVDTGFNQIPGIRVVYNGSKSALETSVGNSETVRPVKVETWDDILITGFVTQPESVDGKIDVLIPMSPPFAVTAFVVTIDEEQVIETDESLNEAVIRVISAGFA